MGRAIFVLIAFLFSVLTVTAFASWLEITPADDFTATGLIGGPFSPSSKDYQLTNAGPGSIYWGVSKNETWLSFSEPDWGQLDPNQSVMVTVSLTSEVNFFGAGNYSDTIIFTDITNDEDQTRDAVVTVVTPGDIWVEPESFDVNVIETLSLTDTLTIGNDGALSLDYTIRTRNLGGSGQSQPGGGSSGSGDNTICSAPQGVGPFITEGAAYKPGELIVRFESLI